MTLHTLHHAPDGPPIGEPIEGLTPANQALRAALEAGVCEPCLRPVTPAPDPVPVTEEERANMRGVMKGLGGG